MINNKLKINYLLNKKEPTQEQSQQDINKFYEVCTKKALREEKVKMMQFQSVLIFRPAKVIVIPAKLRKEHSSKYRGYSCK